MISDKLKFNSIIVLMLISLLGICAMQYFWLERAVNEKADQFNKSATKALYASISDFEEAFAESLIYEEIYDLRQDLGGTEEKLRRSQSELMEKENVALIKELENLDLELKEYKNSLWQLKNNDKDSIQKNWNYVTNNVIIHGPEKLDSLIKGVEIILGETENGSIHSQETRIDWDSGITQNSRIISIENIEEAAKNIFLSTYSKPQLVSERLKSTNLDSLLSLNLKKVGLNEIFIYRIRGGVEDSVAKANSSINTDKVKKYEYSAKFFEAANEPVYLDLSFPGKTGFIVSELKGLIAGSVFLAFLMVLTFAYTILYILKQKKVSEVKSDFINNMTHEFKTPLATIGIATDSIRHPKVKSEDGEIDKFTSIIQAETTRLNNHVERILQAAKMEGSKLNLTKESIDFIEIVEEVLEKFLLRIQENSVLVNRQYSLERILCYCDREHIYNVISNLLDNAIKYSKENAEIIIVVKNLGNELRFEITDKGIGMSKESQKWAFQTFYRAQSGNIHNVKGFGLGLSYVKEIVELHGGEVFLSSKVQEGTTTGFILPLK